MTLLIPSLLALFAMTPDSHAADFTGRVRRIRIRENNSGTNFRTVVQTESSDPSDPGSLEVTVAGLETDQTTVVVGTAKSTRAIVSATATFAKVRPFEDKYTMTAQMRGVQDPTVTMDWVVELDRCEADCAWVEEVLEDGSVARAKLTVSEQADGTEGLAIELRLFPDRLVPGNTIEWYADAVTVGTSDADGDGLPDETAKADLGAGPVYRTRWVTKAWDLDALDTAVQLDATLTNPDGTTDSLADFAVLDLNGETGLAEATIKARKKGGYKVNLWTQATGDTPVGSVFAEVSDAESGEVLAELDLDAPVETTAIISGVLPGTLIEGEKAAAKIALYAGDELLLAEALTLVMGEGLLTTTFDDTGTLALSEAGVYFTEDGSYELAFTVVGADADLVTSATISISARQTVDTVDASVETLWQRWSGVVDTDTAPESFGFDAEVRDSEGTSVDGWAFELQAGSGSQARTSNIGGGSLIGHELAHVKQQAGGR